LLRELAAVRATAGLARKELRPTSVKIVKVAKLEQRNFTWTEREHGDDGWMAEAMMNYLPREGAKAELIAASKAATISENLEIIVVSKMVVQSKVSMNG